MSREDTVAAHTQTVTLRITEWFPEHCPRESDPHYKMFDAVARKMRSAGIGCWVCGSKDIEVHHALVEYAVARGVDIDKFSHLWPEFHVTDDESFMAFVESEGNLQALCEEHHRAPGTGIHCVPYPEWIAQRYWKTGLPAPVSRAS